MELATYVDQDHGRQTVLAKSIGCQAQLVWQWARKARPVPLDRCTAIEQATAGAVRRWDLRPLDWHRIWPELIGDDGAPDVPNPTTTQPGALDAPVSEAGELDAA